MPRKWSSSREASESALGSLKCGAELDNKALEPAWQFEVGDLGSHLDEKEEIIPLKKRKFMFQSPSSSPRTYSLHCKESDGSRVVNDCGTSAHDFGQIVDMEGDVDEKNLDGLDGQEDECQDFSGISLLAAAACCTSFGKDESCAKNGSGFEESCSLSKRISKGDLNSAEISTEGTASCLSLLPTEETDGWQGTDHSSGNVLLHGTNVEDKGLRISASAVLDLFDKRDEEKGSTLEFSSQNDRLHWDLNTTMDMWEHPSNFQCPDFQNAIADVTSEDLKDGNSSDNKANLEGHEMPREPGDECDAERLLPSASKGISNGMGQKNFDEMSLKEPVENGCDSNVSDKNYCSAKFEEDYDYQYEDGEVRESIDPLCYGPNNANNLSCENEVRESIFHTWEDYDGEDLTPEHLEHGSDNDNSLGAKNEVITRNAPRSSLHESVKPGTLTDKLLSDCEDGAVEGNVNEPSQPTDVKMSRSGPVNRPFSGRRKRNVGGDSMDRVGSEDLFLRKFCMPRSGDVGNFNPRSERESGYVKSFTRGRYHVYAKAQEGDRWVHPSDSRRSSRHFHSRNYHGPVSFNRPDVEHGVQRHLARRRLPIDRDEVFAMHSRLTREFSPCKRLSLERGRSMRYSLRMDGGGPTGRYQRPIPDDCNAPLNISHSSTKRERSSSPIEKREDTHSHRSRSPSFRTDVRVQRGRLPNHRPRFSAEHAEDFESMHRSHGSQPHNSRRTINRKDGMFHFGARSYDQGSSLAMDQRLPVSFGPQNNRRELGYSFRNYRDMHPARFSGRGMVSSGLRHDQINDDRRKRDYKYEAVRPTKHYDIYSSVKRFRYSEDGFLDSHGSCHVDSADFNGKGDLKDNVRGIANDSQLGDVLREVREESESQRDGVVMLINSKMQEGEDNQAS
ncbi:hypothetical protein SLE2022_229160 [Rubroshorea leprosula]